MTDCQHVPTSPGQSMCECMDKLMHARLTIELLCRRIVELEREVQHHDPQMVLT